MKINFPMTLTAADTNKRTLTGRLSVGMSEATHQLDQLFLKKTVLTFQSLSNYYLSMTKPDL
jgi:hypothetical protein